VIYDHFNDNSEDVEDMQGDQDYSKEDAWFAFDAFNDYYDNVWEDGYPEIWDLDCDEVVAETEQYSYD